MADTEKKKVMDALDQFVDRVLDYDPKKKEKKKEKRKRVKGVAVS